MSDTSCGESKDITHNKVVKLKTLINSLGGVFRERLLDENATERKMFSVMITGPMNSDLEDVVNLGVEWGYFHKSLIGSKEGFTRNIQLILNRRLAPCFYLDPSGYTAYLSVTPDALEIACINSQRFINGRIKQQENQLTLDLS